MDTPTQPQPIAAQSDKKLYTKGWIFFGTYLGGPLAGCYLASKNFEAMGQKESAEKIFRIGILSTALLFGLILFIPESIMSKIPNVAIPLAYTLVIDQYIARTQGKALEEHIKNNGAKQSGWKVAGIGVISLILSFVYMLALLIVLPESLIGS